MKKIYLIFLLAFYFTTSISQVTDLRCTTLGQPDGSQTQYNQIGYYLNNSPAEYGGCQTTPAIIIAVIDSLCTPWNTCDHNFNQFNTFVLISGSCNNSPMGDGPCRTRPENYFIFQLNNHNQLYAMDSMLNVIPNNFYVLAYTWYTYAYSSIPSFKTSLINLGASAITALADNNPYIFFMKKGDTTSVIEVVGNLPGDTITLNTTLNCVYNSIAEFNNDQFVIYPNPVLDKINFNSEINCEWEIYDLSGQKISSGQLKNESKIHLKNLPSGTYLLKITSKEGTFNKTFLKY